MDDAPESNDPSPNAFSTDEDSSDDDSADGSPHAHLSRDELEAQITELAGHLNAASYRWLTLIAEFDRRVGWNDGRLHSCAHWLNFKVGLNLGAAREKVRVAHALAGVPKIAAAMARGELSYSKVRALTRVATPATEEALLMIAHHGTAHHVETTVRYFRRAEEAALLSREQQQQLSRSVHYWHDEDGSLVLKARLPALAGALLVNAVDRGDQQRGRRAAAELRGTACGRVGSGGGELSGARGHVRGERAGSGQRHGGSVPGRDSCRCRNAEGADGGSLPSRGRTDDGGADGAAPGLRCKSGAHRGDR
jgi:hypothetical protein